MMQLLPQGFVPSLFLRNCFSFWIENVPFDILRFCGTLNLTKCGHIALTNIRSMSPKALRREVITWGEKIFTANQPLGGQLQSRVVRISSSDRAYAALLENGCRAEFGGWQGWQV